MIAPKNTPAMSNAFIHRDVHMDFFVDSFWYKPSDETKAKRWLDGFWTVMQAYWNGHSYQNYPHRDDPNYRWEFWGDAFPSLLFVKQKYDPGNVFTFPQAISPVPADAGHDVRRSHAPSIFSDPVIVYS